MKFILLLLIDMLFLLNSFYDLQMLQQNGYNNKHKYKLFLKNDYKNNSSVYLLKYLYAITMICFDNLSLIIIILSFMVLIMLNINAYINFNEHNNKLPLKFTKRLIRIMTIDYALILILQIFMIRELVTIFLAIVMFYIAMHGYILICIVYLLSPLEMIIFNHYKHKALKKLNSMPNLNKIGITGSFGKTSTKMVLNTLLKTKYKGFYTPASYNTPNGVLLTINNEKTIFNDYFISEMGARKEGEIKELANLVKPKYGILTKIGEAHLETFGSLENICNTKFELIESLPSDGVAVLNKDDKYQRNYELKNNCKVVWYGIGKDADVTAKNINITNKGTSFEIVFKGEKKPLKVCTILLGEKNIYNILASVALAKELGLSNEQIVMGIKNIEPIEHRLELKQFGNITILDDAYNANPVGAKNALDTLKLFEGDKIVITPGMIEMGEEEETLNKEFGKQIAQVADYVYLIGEKQTKSIYEGLIKKKFNKDHIFVYNDFKKAYNEAIKIKSKHINILIENDLPDSYMEVKK